jgi:hypothetical protein
MQSCASAVKLRAAGDEFTKPVAQLAESMPWRVAHLYI